VPSDSGMQGLRLGGASDELDLMNEHVFANSH